VLEYIAVRRTQQTQGIYYLIVKQVHGVP